MRPFRFVASVFLGLALAHSAFAAGIAIKPAQVSQKVEPGSTLTLTMTVTNGDASEHTFYPVVRNVVGTEGAGQPVFESASSSAAEPHDLTAWLSFDKSPIKVGAGQSASLTVTANFPADVTPGSHIGGFFFSDKPAEISGILGASVGFDVGSLMDFQVPGDKDSRAEIRHFSVEHGVYTKPPVNFSVAVESQGNTLVRPTGIIEVTNMFGKQVASLPVNENGAGVYPKTTREWQVAWDTKEIVFGRFTAQVALAVETESGSDTITRQVTFWVLPTNIILPVIIGFAVFLLISYILLRIYVRSQIGAAKKGNTARAAEGLSIFTSVLIGLLLAIIIGFLVVFFYFG